MRLKRMVPMYCQKNESDCGPTCIRVVTDYYWKPKGIFYREYTAIGILLSIFLLPQTLDSIVFRTLAA